MTMMMKRKESGNLHVCVCVRARACRQTDSKQRTGRDCVGYIKRAWHTYVRTMCTSALRSIMQKKLDDMTILITTAGLVCGVGTFVILLIRMAINFGTKVRVREQEREGESAQTHTQTHIHTHP